MNDLSQFPKKNPFKVPENYFDSLSENIQERIEVEENPPKRELSPILKPYLWMAASVIGFVLILKMVLNITVDPQYKIQQVSMADTQQMNITNQIPVSLEENEMLWDNTIDATSDEIIDYLSEQDLDTETIIANL